MELNNPTFSPTLPAQRLVTLDIMRGIVLCGILLMNINGFGLANAYSDPTIAGGYTGYNEYTWIATSMFFEGTMRALFSLLFGVGMYILLDRLEKSNAGIRAADIYFRRLSWLLLFGVIHAYLLIWSREILFNYALMGFLVYSFRRLPAKKLIIIAGILFSIGALWNFLEYKSYKGLTEKVALAEAAKASGTTLDKESSDALKEWEGIQEKRSPEFIQHYNESMQKDYFSVVAFNAPVVMEWKTYGPYRYDVWDILSMMLLGIALYKLKILTGEKSTMFYFWMVVIGYVVGLTVNYFETKHILDNNFSFMSFYETNTTYDLGRIPVSLGHIGLIILFCKSNFFSWLKTGLASVGKMALTNYIMHSVICMFVFTGVGFGLFGKLQRFELLYVVFSIWIFQLIISPIWLRYFHYGPMEWLWRRLSYLETPPFKKNNI